MHELLCKHMLFALSTLSSSFFTCLVDRSVGALACLECHNMETYSCPSKVGKHLQASLFCLTSAAHTNSSAELHGAVVPPTVLQLMRCSWSRRFVGECYWPWFSILSHPQRPKTVGSVRTRRNFCWLLEIWLLWCGRFFPANVLLTRGCGLA